MDAAELLEENRRLRERLGPRGLEVVEIGGVGHYVNEKVKAEIEQLRYALDRARQLANAIDEMAINPKGGKMASIAYHRCAQWIRDKIVRSTPTDYSLSTAPLSRLFAALQFLLNGKPDEISAILGILQYRFDPVESPLREPGLHVLCPKFFSSHVDFFSYEVLTMTEISHMIYTSSRQEMDMTYRAHIEGFTNHFQTVEALKAWALALLARYPDLRGKEVQIWKATWVGRDGASYNATPSKVCVLGT